ncbi:MAG TPA: hypothetical protein VG734_11655 [Lacunisphaera sp.]|nr:hypothetical protein [Lacunisphaera sp.]
MGWGRMLLLGNLGQQLDIQDNQSALQEIEQRLQQSGRVDEETARYLRELNREHLELRLYYVALVRVLVAKGVIGREELIGLVNQIDGADGKVDGGFSGPLSP